MGTRWSEHFFSLLDAYERLGEHIYGVEWTFDERKLWKGGPHPRTLRRSLTRNQERIRRTERALKRIRDLKSGEVGEHALTSLIKKERRFREILSTAQANLHEVEELLPNAERRTAAEERMEVAQSTLLRALAEGKLVAYEYGNASIDQNLWNEQFNPDWVVEFSAIWLPTRRGGKRRKLVGVMQKEFRRWCTTVERKGPPREHTLENFCLPLLINLLEQDEIDGKAGNNESYFELVRDAASEVGLELTKYKFDNYVWKRKPERFARPGRKRRK